MNSSTLLENNNSCPKCGGPITDLREGDEPKKDACYRKVKASSKIWPSAYASGRLVQCRKQGASNYGNKSESIEEEWSDKYKSSINCSSPKGFSQKAHCAGKNESVDEAADKVKPRNFVAKNIKQSGQGKHKDMKRAEKQGDVKHKAQTVPQHEVDEGIGGNMQVRSTPLNLRTPKVPQISKQGKGPHNNALKKAQAKRMTENFIQWAVNEGYTNLTNNPAVYEQAKLAYKLNENLTKASTEQLQAIWNSHKDEQRPSPALTMKLKAVVRELQRRRSTNEDWQKANKKDKTDGMSQKAVNSYKRANPGSKLKTAVTTKPSKLKKGSKSAKRRSSYCSRSKGQQKMHNISCSKTPDKAICKARRRWNCESQEQFDAALFETMKKNKELAPGEYFVWTVYFDDGSEKQIKVTKDTFDPKAYYAKKNQNVVKTDYSWDVQGG